MAGLPPPPINDKPGSFTWLEWYRQLRSYVSTSGSVPWYILNFQGSNITDIAIRLHNTLQGLQGGTSGEMYHLTAAQHAALTAGPHNNLSGLQGGNSTERYHLTLDQHSAVSTAIEILDTSATVVLPTTPTLFVMPTVVSNNGITYNTTTGEFVFTYGGSYMFTCMLNAEATGDNRILYFYAEIDTGSGYAIRQYSARSARLQNTTEEQTLFSSTNYWPKGSKLKLYVWASAATITLKTTDIPGTTAGTVTVPAARILFAGGL